MQHRNLLIFGSLTVVVLLWTSGVPAAIEAPHADPCALTTGATAVFDRVCLDGRTITTAEGPVGEVESAAHAGVQFVAFTVTTPAPVPPGAAAADPRVVVSRDGATWSAHLPGPGPLLVRIAADVLTAPASPAAWGDDPYRVVGLATPMLVEWALALEAHGAMAVSYLSVNHFLVHLGEASDETALAALPFVRSIDRVPAAMKVEPGLVAAGGDWLLHVLATGLPGSLDRVEQAALALEADTTAKVAALDRITIRLAAADIPLLAAHPDVLWIGQTSDEAETDMDIIRVRVGAEAVQTAPLGFDGTGVVGQVMDSGLQTTHPDFQASLIEVDGPNTIATHGTSVYGIVFGDGTGNPNAVGMAPGAGGTFAWYSSGMSRYEHASNLAERWGGVFQTHSWGRNIPKDNTYDSHSVEMDRIVQELDVLGLQSMSNCGPGCARREAMAKNILSIGALYHQDSLMLANDFWHAGSQASTGPAADGRIKPELVGPYDRILTTTVNGYTTGFGGTSGATPVNAGAVAIVHQMVQDGLFGPHPQGRASPAAAKALLVASAHTYGPTQVDHTASYYTQHEPKWLIEPYKRDIQGWGVVQLDRLPAAAGTVLLSDQAVALATGDTWSIDYMVPAGATRLHIALTWTDPPASPTAQVTLVNDLDLLVQAGPLGLVPYWGNFGLNLQPTSLPLGLPDRLNNLENVILATIGGETVTINVLAAAVNVDADPTTPGPTQRFALAVVPVFED